jgi:hypothetical protein
VSETGCSTIDGVAVTNGISTRYAYDANGNTLSGNGKTYAWTAFNKPWKIDANGAESQFWYGPDRSRYKQVTSDNNGVTTTTLYIGGLFQVKVSWPTYWTPYLPQATYQEGFSLIKQSLWKLMYRLKLRLKIRTLTITKLTNFGVRCLIILCHCINIER